MNFNSYIYYVIKIYVIKNFGKFIMKIIYILIIICEKYIHYVIKICQIKISYVTK